MGRMSHKVNFLTKFKIKIFLSHRLVSSPRPKSLVFPTILPIPAGRRVELILYPWVFVLCEMQIASSRI